MMSAYIFNVLLICAYSLIYNLFFKGNSRVKLALIVTSIMQLIALLGLKNISLGSDMPNYWEYYDNQLRWSLIDLVDERFEVGFKILTKLTSSITENLQIYLSIIAILSIAPIGCVIYKYSKMPFLSLLLYIFLGFYSFNFSGLRQSIALGIIFIAYIFLSDAKPFKFIATVALAACFHASALAFLPAYLFRKFKFNSRRLVLLFVLATIIFIFNAQLLTWATATFYRDFSVVITDSYTWMAISILTLLACMKLYKRTVASDARNIPLYSLVCIGAIAMLFAPVADNVMRIANYYYIFVILLIPAVLAEIRMPRKRMLVTTVVVCIFAGIYMYLLSIDGYGIVPYRFFWETIK